MIFSLWIFVISTLISSCVLWDSFSALNNLNISSLKSWSERICRWLMLVGSSELNVQSQGSVLFSRCELWVWCCFYVLWGWSLTRRNKLYGLKVKWSVSSLAYAHTPEFNSKWCPNSTQNTQLLLLLLVNRPPPHPHPHSCSLRVSHTYVQFKILIVFSPNSIYGPQLSLPLLVKNSFYFYFTITQLDGLTNFRSIQKATI